MSGRPRRNLPVGWLFMAGAALVTILFYRDFIFHPDRLLFGTDMLGEGFPLRQFAVEELRAGRGVPLWTPYVYGGMPYVALLPGPLFYPSSLLYLMLPLYRAVGWTFALHTFLAAGFGYFLARSFRLRPASAAVCGASFMLTGYVTSHLYGGHDGRIFAMVLIPLALGCLERALRGGGARWWAALAVAVALQMFTPHTQLMYFSSLALALYLAFHLATRAGGGGAAGYARPLLGFAGAFALAAGLGAVQLLPTLALLEHVVRAATESGYAFAASWALPPQELSALFLPDLIGSLPGTYWGSNPFKLHTEYLGAVPLALVALAVAGSLGSRMPREQRRAVWFLAGASLLGLLFALGAATPVHRVAYTLVPMMRSFRAPAMMIGPVACFVALLAAFGWERALRAADDGAPPETGEASPAGARRRPAGRSESDAGRPVEAGPGGSVLTPLPALALLSLPVVLLGLAALLSPAGLLDFAYFSWYPEGWPRRPPPELRGALRVGGLFVVAGWAVALGAAEATARRRRAGLALAAVLLLTAIDLWRVDTRYLRVEPAEAVLAADPVIESLRERLAPGQRAWAVEGYGPNDFMYHGIPTPDGSQKFLLGWYSELMGGIRPSEGLVARPVPLWGLLDLRYLVARPGIQAAQLEPLGDQGLYALRDTTPHAYFPERVELASDAAAALSRTLAIELPGAVAILEPRTAGGVAGGPAEGVAGAAPPAGAGTAEVVSYEPDEVVLRVSAERGGLLVVSEVWHPSWTARIDGAEARVWRANAAFRGVEVPAGDHTVTFRYESRAFRAGAALSLVSLLLTLGLLAGPLLGRRLAARGPGRREPAP